MNQAAASNKCRRPPASSLARKRRLALASPALPTVSAALRSFSLSCGLTLPSGQAPASCRTSGALHSLTAPS